MPISINNTTLTFNDSTTQTSAATVIPAGTVMLFYQAAAPTGFTQVTTENNKALRVVSGTGGVSGGTTAFSTVFTNQSPTTGATTLSTAEIPSHTHTRIINTTALQGGDADRATFVTTATANTGATGGGGSHTHTGGSVLLNVQYIDIILCSKN